MPKDKQTLTWSDMENIGSVSDLVNAHPTKEPTSFEIRPSAAVVDQDSPEVDVDKDGEWTEHDAIRRKEAGDVLSWLNANGCLRFGALPNALAAIEAGKHRR